MLAVIKKRLDCCEMESVPVCSRESWRRKIWIRYTTISWATLKDCLQT